MSDLSVHDMAANIVAVYRRATIVQRADGRDWYPKAGSIVRHIATETRQDAPEVAMALAALSPRNPWRWNVADVYIYAAAARDGRPMPTATTFRRNQRVAWDALTGDVPYPFINGPKVRSFVKAILGDHSSVVVDTWAARVATGGDVKHPEKRYADFVRAYTVAARYCGEAPREMQAITWLVAQTEGLASQRRGRHDLSFKAGTPEFVKDLLS